jgi:hypothetical protein
MRIWYLLIMLNSSIYLRAEHNNVWPATESAGVGTKTTIIQHTTKETKEQKNQLCYLPLNTR